jgi:hypothetical protein
VLDLEHTNLSDSRFVSTCGLVVNANDDVGWVDVDRGVGTNHVFVST